MSNWRFTDSPRSRKDKNCQVMSFLKLPKRREQLSIVMTMKKFSKMLIVSWKNKQDSISKRLKKQ